MKKAPCPCCEGTGLIELLAPLPTTLTRTQGIIYRAIKARPGMLNCDKLVYILYSGDADGGPDFAHNAVYVQINKTNERLSVVNEKIVSSRRGPGAVYRIEKLHVV